MTLVGLTLGPSIPLYVLALQNGMPPPTIGVVTASATFFRQIGGTLGIAILVTVFLTRIASGFESMHAMGMSKSQADLALLAFVSDATRWVFRVGVVMAILGFLQTLRLPEIPLRKTHR